MTMKRNVPMLMLMALLLVAFAVTMAGCPEEEVPVDPMVEEPPPLDDVLEGVPEAVEEVYTDEEPQPGMEELPPPTEEELQQEPPIGDQVNDAPPPVDDM